MYSIFCVIDQPEQLNEVLNAWRQHGITGVTILESTGLHRLLVQPHVPMRYVFSNPSAERGNITLFTVVDREEIVHQCLEWTEAVVGDFNDPNTGIFVSWPIGFSKGVTGKLPRSTV